MQTEWQTFLEDLGANVVDGLVADFGDPGAELKALGGDVVADLSHYGLIAATGDDALDFLQGQLSNDVREVSEEHHQLSAYCSPKGRALALVRLFRRPEGYYLRLPQELVEPTLKRLRMYVLRSKVMLGDSGEQLVRFGISGPQTPALLAGLMGSVPEAVDTSVTRDGVTLLRIAGTEPRFEIYGPVEPMKEHWRALAHAVHPVGAAAWGLLEVRAGLPNVYQGTVEAFVPQMMNLQLVNGLSFRKGCYPGQEVVARMQYLGKLKRRMYLAHLETETAPRPGDELNAKESESGQGAGRIVEAHPAPEGGYDLLAVVQIDAAEGGEVNLGPSGDVLHFRPLPYTFEKEEDRPQ